MRGCIKRTDVGLAFVYEIIRAAAVKRFVGVWRERVGAASVRGRC